MNSINKYFTLENLLVSYFFILVSSQFTSISNKFNYILWFGQGLIVTVVIYNLIKNNWKINLKRLGFFELLLVLLFFIDLINVREVSDLKITLVSFTPICIVSFLSVNINYQQYKEKVIKVFSIMMIYLVFFSISNIVFQIEVLTIEKNYYLSAEVFPSIFTLQRVNGLGLSRRYSSLFSNQNYFGLFSFLYFALLYEHTSRQHSTRFLLIFPILGLILSFSRTAIFCTLGYILIKEYKRYIQILKLDYKKLFYFLLFFVGIGIAIYLIRGNIFSFGRGKPWDSALSIIGLKPILGFGIKGFNLKMLKLSGFRHAHNTYLQVMGSSGIIGLSSYLLIMITIVKKTYQTRKKIGSDYFILITIFLIIYQLVENLMYGTLYYFPMLISFYYISINISSLSQFTNIKDENL